MPARLSAEAGHLAGHPHVLEARLDLGPQQARQLADAEGHALARCARLREDVPGLAGLELLAHVSLFTPPSRARGEGAAHEVDQRGHELGARADGRRAPVVARAPPLEGGLAGEDVEVVERLEVLGDERDGHRHDGPVPGVGVQELHGVRARATSWVRRGSGR